jgi:hypothetical protein
MSGELSPINWCWRAFSIVPTLVIGLELACSSQTPRPSSPCLHYEPEVIELRGELREIFKYGPPNYGENPDSDRQMWIPMLELRYAVTICGDSSSEINKDSISGIREIQLLFPEPQLPYRTLNRHSVKVTGTLEQATFGPMFTAVVLTVRTLESDTKRE